MKKIILISLLALGFCNGVAAAGAAPGSGQYHNVMSFRPGTPPPKGQSCQESVEKFNHTSSDYLGGDEWDLDLIDRKDALDRGLQDFLDNPREEVKTVYVNYLTEFNRRILVEVSIVSALVLEKQKIEGFRFLDEEKAFGLGGIADRYYRVLAGHHEILSDPVLEQQLMQHIPSFQVSQMRDAIMGTVSTLEVMMGMYDDPAQ